MRETAKAKQAFKDYWNLGPGRSQSKLLEKYIEDAADGRTVPTLRDSTISEWSSKFNWVQRVKDKIEKLAQEQLEGYKEELLKSEYANVVNRIGLIDDIINMLEEEARDDEKRWSDNKFNYQLINTLLKAVGDMAAETGGRVKGVEIAGKEDAPLFNLKELIEAYRSEESKENGDS